jgi:hypothetical protein
MMAVHAFLLGAPPPPPHQPSLSTSAAALSRPSASSMGATITTAPPSAGVPLHHLSFLPSPTPVGFGLGPSLNDGGVAILTGHQCPRHHGASRRGCTTGRQERSRHSPPSTLRWRPHLWAHDKYSWSTRRTISRHLCTRRQQRCNCRLQHVADRRCDTDGDRSQQGVGCDLTSSDSLQQLRRSAAISKGAYGVFPIDDVLQFCWNGGRRGMFLFATGRATLSNTPAFRFRPP